MYIKRHFLLFLIVILSFLNTHGQQKEELIDSLKNVINSNVHDSIKVKAYKRWDGLIYKTDPELDLKIIKKIDSIAEVNLEKKLHDSERTFFLFMKSFSQNTLGVIAKQQGNYVDAIKYYNNTLRISEELGREKGIAIACNNLALVYHDQGMYGKAIELHTKGLMIKEKLNDQKGVALSLNNMGGGIYKDQKEYDLAQESYYKSLRIYEEIDNKIGIVSVHNILGNIQRLKKNNQKSLHFYFKGLTIEKEIEYEKGIAASYTNIGDVYKDMGMLDSALYLDQKQKVDEAYEVLDEKNNEILDSIVYAKRVQSAILPPIKNVKEYLPHSFVLYKPIDIVAGDFYWFEKSKDQILIAAADCTGHGVPGAMVSVVCNNGLNRSVREYGLTEPAKILDKSREIVIAEFEKSEEEVKDGMDIALISLKSKQSEFERESGGHLEHSKIFPNI